MQTELPYFGDQRFGVSMEIIVGEVLLHDLEMSQPNQTLDLERVTTFSDYNAPASNTNYNVMEEELGMMDEEVVNWPVLCTRIFAFFLLFLIIICFALEEITQRFLLLAAIIGVLLVIVIFSTYFDIRRIICCCRKKRNEQQQATLDMLTTNPIQKRPY